MFLEKLTTPVPTEDITAFSLLLADKLLFKCYMFLARLTQLLLSVLFLRHFVANVFLRVPAKQGEFFPLYFQQYVQNEPARPLSR